MRKQLSFITPYIRRDVVKTKQSGITLIELMIVVAIIGILAAVAIPSYNDYITKSKVTEPVLLMNGIKKAILADILEPWPAADDTGESLASLLGPPQIRGEYVEVITSNGKDAITARMKSNLAQGIANKTVSLQFHLVENFDHGEWICVRGILSESIPDKYLPRNCRNDYQS
jgi:type IV pilus assembly protein PilA